jgi:excisionase family DNA binding protein
MDSLRSRTRRRCQHAGGSGKVGASGDRVALPPKSDISGQCGGRRRPRGLTWRPKARAYFDENPEGFCRIRDDVLDREWVRAPFAYFMQLLKDGDHCLLTDAEAAELLAVPKSWVGEAASAGRLPHVMLERYRRFDRVDLLAWLEENKTGSRRRLRAAA